MTAKYAKYAKSPLWPLRTKNFALTVKAFMGSSTECHVQLFASFENFAVTNSSFWLKSLIQPADKELSATDVRPGSPPGDFAALHFGFWGAVFLSLGSESRL